MGPSTLARVDGPPDVSSVELRWFAEGPLPPDVEAWFLTCGAAAAFEERTDTYRLDDLPDLGVKLRFGEFPELKTRQAVRSADSLRGLPSGELECWHKWSVTGDLEEATGWLQVHKRIIRRRFTPDGDETEVEIGAAPPDVGCDVEVVELSVGGDAAWTFAFAAYGPVDAAHQVIATAWSTLVASTSSIPEDSLRLLDATGGYPAWLAGRANRRQQVSSPTATARRHAMTPRPVAG